MDLAHGQVLQHWLDHTFLDLEFYTSGLLLQEHWNDINFVLLLAPQLMIDSVADHFRVQMYM